MMPEANVFTPSFLERVRPGVIPDPTPEEIEDAETGGWPLEPWWLFGSERAIRVTSI